MFDEIAIRQHVEHDGQKYHEYVDMGDNKTSANNTFAREALVFIVVCINGAWKVSVAYFLVDKITAEQKKKKEI